MNTYRIELLDLAAFIQIAEDGSFHNAARALHLSQPALTRRIKKLEALLDAKLLDRTTRHTHLAPLGLEFLPKARRLLENYDASLQSIRDLATSQTGMVTIACLPTAAFYFLPSVIKVFNATYPGIRVRILDVSANEGVERVVRGDADFGINMISVQHPDLEFTPLLTDPFVLALRADHPLAKKDTIEWPDLEDVRMITVSRDSGNRILLDNSLAATSIRLNGFYEVQHLSTSLGLVERGLGIAILPRMATPESGHGMLCTKELPGPRIQRKIGLLRRHKETLSNNAERFIEMLLGQWQENWPESKHDAD